MLRLMAYNEKANSNKANVLNHHSAPYVSQNKRSFSTNNPITMNADSAVAIENQGCREDIHFISGSILLKKTISNRNTFISS